MHHLGFLFAILLVLVGSPAASQGPPPLSVKSLMTPPEFSAAGLNKLTPEELASLDRWMNRLVDRALTLAQTSAPAGAKTYAVQASVNDEKFIINGQVYEAQTYCFGVEKGDQVMFISGSALGACATAEFVAVRTSKSCKVWCK